MQNKSGFTLAEVLITLGIIGVVAAMTIPTLMTNTTASQFKTAYKKSISSLKQGITMNVAMDDFDLRDLAKDSTGGLKAFRNIIVKRFEGAEDITSSYFDANNANDGTGTIKVSTTHICTGDEVSTDDSPNPFAALCENANIGDTVELDDAEYDVTADNFVVFLMADGTAFGFNKNAEKCSTSGQENCVGFIDTNGPAGPNRINVCDNPAFDTGVTCIVSNEKVADIFPVKFYNQTVEPGSVAAKSILMGFKANKAKTEAGAATGGGTTTGGGN